MRLTGETGTPGEDGDDTEWIYNYSTSGYNGNTGQVRPGESDPHHAASGSDTNKQQADWITNG